MLFTIIFGFLTLLGFSLFIAVLLSSILKAKTKRIIKKKELFNELAYRKALERKLRSGIAHEVREISTARSAGMEQTAGVGIPSGRALAPGESRGVWAIPLVIILGVLVLVIGITMGGRIIHTIKSRPKVYFSEGINYLKMKPKGVAKRFTRGKVNVFVKFPETLSVDKLLYEVYRLEEEGLVKYDEMVITRKPGKTVYVFKRVFDKTGTYIVYLKDYTTRVILNKLALEIVPDEYAYKPVVKE